MEGSLRKSFLVLVLTAFAALTMAAVAEHGYVGLFKQQLQSLAGLQVMAWLWRDARACGRNP